MMFLFLLISEIYLVSGQLAIGTIITIAGTGNASYNGDGQATSSYLNYPYGIFKDTNYLWVAEYMGQRVRRINSSNIITAFAGVGTVGSSGDNGQATSAYLRNPISVVIFGMNALIADFANHRIRQVDMTSGIIETIAGTGTNGYTDGVLATSCMMDSPRFATLNGNYIYITDSVNNRVRRVDLLTKTINTYAGNGNTGYNGAGGMATSNAIGAPRGLFLTSSHLYISSNANYAIYRVKLSDQSMIVFTGTGSNSYGGDGGQTTSASVSYPYGIHISFDKLWFADVNLNRVRLILLSSGIISTFAGTGAPSYSGDNLQATSATFFQPISVAADGDYVWISDYSNHRIRRVTIRRYSASIFGDPHFIGFAGGRYTLDLIADQCYAIFASQKFQWNSCAVQSGHRESIFLGKMGFWIDNNTVQIPLHRRHLCVIVNQKQTCSYSYTSYKISLSSGFTINLFRTFIVLTTPCFRLRLHMQIRSHVIRTSSKTNQHPRKQPQSHFDAIVSSIDKPASFCHNAHGLLGVTWDKLAQPTGKNGEGVLEGQLSDYQINSIMETQFKYNRFQTNN